MTTTPKSPAEMLTWLEAQLVAMNCAIESFPASNIHMRSQFTAKAEAYRLTIEFLKGHLDGHGVGGE